MRASVRSPSRIFLLPNPLLRRLRRPQELGEGVDEHHSVDVLRVGHRIEPDDQPPVGVPDDHERRFDLCGADQRMEVGDRVGNGDRHRHRVAAAGAVIGERRSRAVIGTDPRELRDIGEDGRVVRPFVGGGPPAGHNEDGGRSRSAALEVHLPAAANVDRAGEIAVGRECRQCAGCKEYGEEQRAPKPHGEPPGVRSREHGRGQRSTPDAPNLELRW